MIKPILAGSAILLASAVPALAQDDDGIEVGLLECVIEGGADLAIISSDDLTCTFTPASEEEPTEDYVGVVNQIGLDAGITSESIMEWAVLAPTADSYTPGALAGDYVGASAEATAAVGGGANVLIGGSDETITLQPVSVEAQTGLNIAIGVTDFQLRSAE